MLLIVDCAPNSKEYNMKCDSFVLRDASEAPSTLIKEKKAALVPSTDYKISHPPRPLQCNFKGWAGTVQAGRNWFRPSLQPTCSSFMLMLQITMLEYRNLKLQVELVVGSEALSDLNDDENEKANWWPSWYINLCALQNMCCPSGTVPRQVSSLR